jgi:hypothetical protein
MSKALKIFGQFLRDEEGAALIEYTVLLGILLIAVISDDRSGWNLGFEAMAPLGQSAVALTPRKTG